eukprot:6207203-Pleurochrysis_carterae.AAC.2
MRRAAVLAVYSTSSFVKTESSYAFTKDGIGTCNASAITSKRVTSCKIGTNGQVRIKKCKRSGRVTT